MRAKPGRKSGTRVRGGTLFLISLLLLGSASLRIGVQAGPALTQGGKDLAAAVQSPQAEPATVSSENLGRLLIAFQDREDAILMREREIEDKMVAMQVAEAALQAKIDKLVAAEDRLSATLALADSASEDDLAQLTSVYARMKPKDAAALFEEMNPQFAAGFLARMQPDTAASIMAGLSPKVAYTVSVVLAGRHANVPQD